MEFNALTSTTIDYDLDAIGNRIAETFNGSTSIYAYSLTSSWLNSIDSEMLTYDQTGNMDTDRSGNRVFTYNAAGRLAQVDDLSGMLGQYTYDANGQRSRKTTASGSTQFIYGAGGRLLGEYDASGDAIREYVYLNGEPLAQVNADESVLYLHTDHLATPRAATNQAGTQVWGWESDAFGRGAPSGTETVNLRFPGQYYDDETALHYNWNRYYNPDTGRYITSDPIGLEGGNNTYAYVNANPVMFTDPEGLEAASPPASTPSNSAPDNVAGRAMRGILLRRCIGVLRGPVGIFLDVMTPTAIGDGTCPDPTCGMVLENKQDEGKKEQDKEAQKRAERERYHEICDTPPPKTGDACEDAKADLSRWEMCLDARKAFARKWFPNSTEDHHFSQVENAIRNSEQRVRAHCGPDELF